MRSFALVASALATLLLASCASYQLGNPASLSYRSVHVAPPRNLSTLPQIEGAVNTALRKELAQSASLELASDSQSDVVLEITILDSKRRIAAVTADDVGRGRKFELSVDLALSLRRTGTPDDYLIRDRAFTVTQDVFTDSGQVNAEYQGTVEIARSIAVRAAEIIQDHW